MGGVGDVLQQPIASPFSGVPETRPEGRSTAMGPSGARIDGGSFPRIQDLVSCRLPRDGTPRTGHRWRQTGGPRRSRVPLPRPGRPAAEATVPRLGRQGTGSHCAQFHALWDRRAVLRAHSTSQGPVAVWTGGTDCRLRHPSRGPAATTPPRTFVPGRTSRHCFRETRGSGPGPSPRAPVALGKRSSQVGSIRPVTYPA
jgi:hypothetical protein